jgi:F0F1-type ATP synthase delta subunit
LEKTLTAKFNRDLQIKEVLDREIMAGIVIEIGSFMIDGSLLDRFKKAAEKIA